MDYVRVDWDNGDYSYFKNDTFCHDEYRNSFLLSNHFSYKRIRRLPELPKGKKCMRYKRHNKQDKDWKLINED